ncbi:MAG: 50S ribosomal protein L24 [Candidatus Bathyarchaeia archaeon]|nr:50S ribosomal protein L24 [Candidatus Bathyarchaeota archaeon]
MQVVAKTSKPSKQRKRLFQAPDHIRYKHLAAPLSPELRKTYGTRSLPVRAGDTVLVMRGDRKGFEGKVSRIDRKKFRIYIEGLTRERVDGTTVFVPVHPSKVMITKLNLDDKWRRKILERRRKAKEAAEVVEKVEEKVEKPPEALVKVEEKPVEEKAAVVAERLPPAAEEEKPKRRRAAKKTVKKTAEEEAKPKAEAKAKPRRRRKASEESRVG